MHAEVHGDVDAWPLIGTALVGQSTNLLLSIIDLSGTGRPSSATILLRGLFERAVYLAWLGVDPSAKRIEAWRKDDLKNRLIADSEWRERGVALLTDENRSAMENEVARLEGGRLVLADLAVQADQDWSGRLPSIDLDAPGPARSFRGHYAVIYRYTSTAVHPSFSGLNRFVTETSSTGRTVGLQERELGEGWNPFSTATVIFGLCLYVASAALGWPAREAIDAVYQRYEN